MIRIVLIASLLLGCAPSRVPPPNACTELATAFHLLASNKDRGSSYEEQVAFVRQDRSSRDSERYLLGILGIVYAHPDRSAEQIRSGVVAACTLDEHGRAHLPAAWDPWRADGE